jgi:hypothetical protein
MPARTGAKALTGEPPVSGSAFSKVILVGDWLAAQPARQRWTVALLVLWLNHKVTHGLAIGRWVY